MFRFFARILPGRRVEPSSASVGRCGERAAEALLKKKGFRVLARNWRSGRDEIDLVCQYGQAVVFVETRTRSERALVGGYDSIDARKKKALHRVCRAYLGQMRPPWKTVRFDVVEVEHTDGVIGACRHFEDVPLFSKSARRG